MKSCGKSPIRVMVTRSECFWVACNRLIIRFFCVYVVREGKGWCQTGVVSAIGVSPSPIRGVHGLMATRLYSLLYKGYTSS